MRKILFAFFFFSAFLYSAPYQSQEKAIKKIIQDKQINFVEEILPIINYINNFAGYYPTQFDNDKDREKARKDANVLLEIISTPIKEKAINVNSPEALPFILSSAKLSWMIYNINGNKNGLNLADGLYAKALNLNKNNVSIKAEYGAFLVANGNLEKGETLLKEAINAGVNSAYYDLALLNVIKKNNKEAKKLLDKYIASYPNDTNAQQLKKALNKK